MRTALALALLLATAACGSDDAPSATPSSAAPTAVAGQVALSARDYSFVGLTDLSPRAGERLTFLMKNLSADNQHDFELQGPDDKKVGAIEVVNPGDEGQVVLTLTASGTYRFLCTIGDHADKGMKGTFVVG